MQYRRSGGMVDALDSKSGAVKGMWVRVPPPAHMHKVVAVIGPTASGKTDAAIDIALAFGGEVVSADSRQVFRGLNLGTGKVTAAEMRGIPHHLIDVADPTESFGADQYRRLATEAIDDIVSRNHLPIVCGGTGFYVDAVLTDMTFPQVLPNVELRESLKDLSAAELFARLQALDPRRAETIDPENPVRLIRAIEIAAALGAVPEATTTPADRYDVLRIGLLVPEPARTELITKRLLARLDAGMLDEARRLHAPADGSPGLSYERMHELGLEYRYMAEHLQGHISYDEMVSTLATRIRQYARRQMTWFKREPRIVWFDPTDPATKANIAELVSDFLRR
jgi:tRNA dimethylallyltransferase